MVNKKPDLLKRLIEYGNSDFYPLHMPGHKRQWKNSFLREFPNPFSIDITEIDGFDNLHRPEGILKDSMEWAAKVYGSDKTYYLVNGSSCGILSAISGTVLHGGTILMSRNCHKSAFHGVFLNHLKTEYIYPQITPELELQGGLLLESVEKMLKTNSEIKAVLVVSPTYEGIISDISSIAEVVHKYHLPLIVDEAHGAHFSFGRKQRFPVSALELGADVVIQSLHKTLPSLTQTAVMHVRRGFVDMERLDRYVSMYQTSSPSYVMMASIENCIRYMEEEGMKRLGEFSFRLLSIRERLKVMKHLRLLTDEVIGSHGIFDIDISKIVVSTRGTGWTGSQLGDRLRRDYHLEMEMCGPDYVIAITTLEDTQEGLDRLCNALLELDRGMHFPVIDDIQRRAGTLKSLSEKFHFMTDCKCSISQAMDAKRHRVLIKDSTGMVSAEFVYVYPPGIPIVVPGERLTSGIIELILEYRKMGLPVQGMEDEEAKQIYVLDEI